ncbi:TonB-dependent receptor [Shewanella holmiensis]|uniref:TonB-dependent receptor n=1 Tax=Shewanella holmiensis TaxID=2952222 RepID=A0A9X2WKN4_9GAMM|nr:TonB-dependent receptor [Shewanella holmiensis]MCT7941018.1 TonB-dependent receptor [Shewanella holmiensis]
MKTSRSLSPIYMALAAASLAVVPQAWSGHIQGIIKDEKSQQPLQGALISIEELNLQLQSNRDGRFFFPEIEAGEYTLVAHYLGGSTYKERVAVATDGVTHTQIQLSGDGLEHIQVVGQHGALSNSLNRQRASDNLVSILSADALGNFPDTNISEALQRVPGLSIERDQGEGRFIRVRGLAPDYNAVSMNGARLPSPESDRRAVALDVLPADLLQSVEVSKTLTPDMDADSLGGSIEVKSLSAFDRDDTHINISAEASHDELTQNINPKLAASYSDIFNDVFGVTVAASWYNRDFGSDNVETGGDWAFDDTSLLEVAEQRDYEINRERLGIGVNFDFRPNENNDLYLRTLYSAFVDNETRNGNEVSWDEGVSEGVTGTVEATRSLKSREETQKIGSLVFGGQSRLDKWTVDYQASWSRATADKPRNIAGAEFESEFDDVLFENSQIPKLIAPDRFYNASEYELKEIEIAESSAEDTIASVQFDLTKNGLITDMPFAVKFGAKYTARTKENSENIWIYEDFEDQGVNGEQLLMTAYSGAESDYNLGRLGPSIMAAPVWNLVNSLNPDNAVDEIESTINDFTIDEDITAAYLMGHVDIDKLRILAGVRFEHTSLQTFGTGFNEEEDDFIANNTERDYEHWLPSIHANYKFSENTVFRASWGNSIVRPTFSQLAPGFLIEVDDDEIEASFGNPDLKALESTNWDLSIEHYMGGVGVISAGAFYKEIKHFIYETDLGGYDKYANFDTAQTFINGDDADITGVELAYVQDFVFLPEAWRGLIFTGNVTWSDSNAQIAWLDDGVQSRNIPLPSQSDITANASLGYENAYVSFNLSAAYKSEYLIEVNELDDANFDIYQDAHTQWDFVAKGYLTNTVTIYLKGINLTDEPLYAYTGRSNYNAQYEEYGRTIQLGIQFINM